MDEVHRYPPIQKKWSASDVRCETSVLTQQRGAGRPGSTVTILIHGHRRPRNARFTSTCQVQETHRIQSGHVTTRLGQRQAGRRASLAQDSDSDGDPNRTRQDAESCPCSYSLLCPINPSPRPWHCNNRGVPLPR